MSHEPPVPAANRSPYPIVEPPHVAKPKLPAIAKRRAPAATGGGTILRLGAAVALGIGATFAALLFARRSPEAAKPKRAKKRGKHAKAK